MTPETHKKISLIFSGIGLLVMLAISSQENEIVAVPIFIYGMYHLIIGKIQVYNDLGTKNRNITPMKSRLYALLYILLAVVIFMSIRQS